MHESVKPQADVKLRPQVRQLNILSKDVINDAISAYKQNQDDILVPLQNLMSNMRDESFVPLKATKGTLQARFNTPFNLQNIDSELQKVQELLIKYTKSSNPKKAKVYVYQSGPSLKGALNLEKRVEKAQMQQQKELSDKLFSAINPQGKLYSHVQKALESDKTSRKAIIQFLETSAKSTKNVELQAHIQNQIDDISKQTLNPSDIASKVLKDFSSLQSKEAQRVKTQFAIDENEIISKLQEPLLKLLK